MSETINVAPTPLSVALRLIELIVLFVAPPLVWATGLWRPHPIAALAVLGAYAITVLLLDRTFDRRTLWRGAALHGEMRHVIGIYLAATTMFVVLIQLFAPELLFSLIRTRPGLWAMVMVGYPVASVYPQELLYRAFFFHRYRDIFPSRWGRIIASAALFAFAHILFGHWIPVAATLIGGLIFAWRFDRTRSLAVVWVEHSIYGQLIFTIGLGAYFYHATLRMTEALAGQ